MQKIQIHIYSSTCNDERSMSRDYTETHKAYVCYRLTLTGVVNRDIIGLHHCQTVFVYCWWKVSEIH